VIPQNRNSFVHCPDRHAVRRSSEESVSAKAGWWSSLESIIEVDASRMSVRDFATGTRSIEADRIGKAIRVERAAESRLFL